MSAALLGLAFKAEAPSPVAKLILLKLVDCARDDGRHIFPSVSTVARVSQCDERTVQRVLKRYCNVGLLQRVKDGGGRGAPASYELNIDVLARLARDGWTATFGASEAAQNGANDAAVEACGEGENGGDSAPPEALNPACDDASSHARDAGQGDACPIRHAEKNGDTVSPFSERVTLAHQKGDMMCHPTPYREPLVLEREGAGAREGRGLGSEAGRSPIDPSRQDPSPPAAENTPIPTLDDFRKRWPTTLADDNARVAAEWALLSLPERAEAVARIGDFVAAVQKLGRSKLPAGSTYLRDRKWRDLPAMAATHAAGETATFEAFSRGWWAVLFHRLQAGEPCSFMVSGAASSRMPVSALKGHATGAEALRYVPASAARAKAWTAWLSSKRLHLPEFKPDQALWLPDRDPPAPPVDLRDL
jgi:hypothetical protein